MKIPVAILLLSLPCHSQPDPAVVRFSNGDQLSGGVKNLSQDALVWESGILKEPVGFDLSHVVDVTLPATLPDQDNPAAGHNAILEMTNGDSIRGRLTALGETEIGLDTWYAGELKLRRVNIKKVTISGVADYIYRGPTSLDEWTVSGGDEAWNFKGGALYCASPGGIARELAFPQESILSFEASWRDAFRTKIVLHSDDIGSTNPRNGYEIVFKGDSVHVKKCGSSNWLGHSSNAGVLRENEKARIEIRTSLVTGKILLFVDGDFIDIWEDGEVAKENLGKGFHVVSQDGSPLRISDITLTAWDGSTEDVPNRQQRLQDRGARGGWEFDEEGREKESSEEIVPEGRMVLKNGDTIEGEVIRIEGEMITLKTSFSEVTFPITRLKNLVLKEADMETQKRYKGDVRATLADDTRLVFRLEGLEDDTITGFSQSLGTANFAMSSFKRMEFNIYDASLDKLRQPVEW